MKVTILVPHYKTLKMTAYTLTKLIEYKGKHDVEIIVIDNCPSDPDQSGKRLRVMFPRVSFIDYPESLMQSHGVAFDYVLPVVQTDYFITIESDSFPTMPNWLDKYEEIINNGFDAAGSLLTLSGGQYMHPAGAIYSKAVWEEALGYCLGINYRYLPNVAIKDGFPCHLMVSDRMWSSFCVNPSKFIKLDSSYLGMTPLAIERKANNYSPATMPFHSGLGQFQESFGTYAARNIESEPAGILLHDDTDFIYRMGYEPGQWLSYWMLATGKALYYIPTKTKWMEGRTNQQQEYTINEYGFQHLWGISSYFNFDHPDFKDIVDFKAKQVEELFQSIQ